MSYGPCGGETNGEIGLKAWPDSRGFMYTAAGHLGRTGEPPPCAAAGTDEALDAQVGVLLDTVR